ncbi:MAG: VOC family protein [Christensenellales bacterium]
MVIPYLPFSGCCEEALLRYIAIFGGEMRTLSRFTQETGGTALAGKVMHAEATIGQGVIAGGDGGDGSMPNTDSIRLMVHCKARAQAQECLDALADGGQILQRLTPHPPPDDAGMGALVRDRYGFTWILTAPND